MYRNVKFKLQSNQDASEQATTVLFISSEQNISSEVLTSTITNLNTGLSSASEVSIQHCLYKIVLLYKKLFTKNTLTSTIRKHINFVQKINISIRLNIKYKYGLL